MKVASLVTLVVFLHLSEPCFSQIVTLEVKDAPLETVLKSISEQTGIHYFANDSVLRNAKLVTLRLIRVPFKTALGFIFKDQDLAYEVQSNTILIIPKGGTFKEKDENKAIDVHGKVVTENGEGLAGANVSLENGKKNVATDNNGQFTLKNIPAGTILMVSFTGYSTKRFPAAKQLDPLVMTLATNQLDEARVIAYGTTTERFSTGNEKKVSGEDIQRQPVDNPLLALEGRVPGLFLKQANGLAGGGVTVRIQGQNSISNGNDPLYIIDGVPYTSQLLTVSIGPLGSSGGSTGTSGNPLTYVNPADIESIVVLKDADATAIYGSRAANGAILFTTKKGKPGQTRFSLTIQQGVGKVARQLPLLNTQQYLEMRHEALFNDNVSTGPADYDINGTWDTTRYTNWQKTLIGKAAQFTEVNASVSGGDLQTQYLVAGTYHRQTSVFPGDFTDIKGNVYLNLNTVSTDHRFTMQVMASLLFDNNRLPQVDLSGQSLILAPDAPALFSLDGKLNWQLLPGGMATWDNPLAYLFKTYRNKGVHLLGQVLFGYHILPGLDAKLSVGYTSLQTAEFSGNQLEALPPAIQEAQGNLGRSALYSNTAINSWIVEPQLNYNRSFNAVKMWLMIGGTAQQEISAGTIYYAYDFATNDLLSDMHSAGFLISPASVQTVYNYNGAFTRAVLRWKDEYLLNLTARRDGSSRFGSAHRFHDFSSVGAGWIFSNERFFQRLFPWAGFGKLKGSYGTTGNDEIGDYRFMNLYTIVNPGVPYQTIPSLGVTTLPNPNLEWEETRKLQFGMDLGFLKERLLVEVSYVRNRSSNELINLNVPAITGSQTLAANVPALVQNTAVEMEVTSINVKNNKFSWSTSINLTLPHNSLVRYYGMGPLPANLVIGKPLGVTHVFEARGVDPATGIYQFSDAHGNPTLSPDIGTDLLKVVSTTLPTLYGGINNNITYKGFTLDLFFQFQKGMASNETLGQAPEPGFGYTNQPTDVLARWRKPGDHAAIQRFNSDRSLGQSFLDAQRSTAFYSSSAFLRVKNISLEWSAPEQLLGRSHLRHLTCFIHGQNLFTFSKFPGVDPESGNGVLPPLRLVTTGCRVEL